ncbi:hypothetical protein RB595_004100 [Gaeumannomyces hyphopodioides]
MESRGMSQRLPESRTASGQVFNAILVVVCRLTKYVILIPTRADTNAAQFAELFFKRVECVFGTPKSIVSDRDSRITSTFWEEVCKHQIIKRRMSTAYHPQTDGQTEVLNRIIENYLRSYCTQAPDSWASLLPLAAYAYNNSRSFTTGRSPFHFLYGSDCEMRM